ncbi:RagB/SusD family nutrient uptake outer membrane protein [Hydrotalea flava]|uniref:RagB/SusD family nutrient uptake outer membrane protein n=1 Tax=Hydrotalea flava TaxID=714549 RepID=UPI00082BEB58|nr:RagB/SusD family nutrient uptake outer membrane protein [Hydrotalea flava]
MNNILKIKLANRVVKPAILCLSMAVIVSGCSKNFLEVPVQGQQPATQIWKTATDAANAVNAIYGNLRSWNNVAFAPICVESVGSDDAAKGSVPSDATFINAYDNFTVTATDGQLDGFWTGQYQNINLCNQVLDNVPNINMDATLKARYLAEAKFVRAYSYFRLVRAFGNIPLILHVPSKPAELNPVQSKPADVYTAIEQDLTDAAGVLPATYGPADIGRATKGAALALHAKVAMYQKKWSDVKTYTDQIIASGTYSLFPSPYQLFRIPNENNVESIFEIQCNYVAGNDGLSNSQYSQVQGNRDANAGWGFNVPTQNLVNEFEPGDPRLNATIMFAGTTTPDGDVVPLPQAGAPSMYNMKSYVPFALALVDNQGADQNVRVIRYAEVLLMNAEANNELGNTAAALASLEKVRARARTQSANPAVDLPPVVTTDQATLRNAIWHERRVELAMEFDRYFDVIRQGRAATVFGPLGWKAGKNEVWPIPQNQIDISGGVLVQNPGY